MLISSVAAIIVAVWFYNTASRTNRNPVQWAFTGFVIYLIVSVLWTFIVTPGIKDAAMHSKNIFLTFIARYAYIAVALICTVIFNLTAEKKQ